MLCHKETLRRAIKSGELLAAKLGKSYRISKTELEEFWQAKGGGELCASSSAISFSHGVWQRHKQPSAENGPARSSSEADGCVDLTPPTPSKRVSCAP